MKKEIDYENKPAKKGYPNEAPPEMVNGFHPNYGKRYKYDKLDPQSAESMPVQGNPEIDANVQKALDLKKPIVALESTLISHGLPYPDNIKVAKESIKAIEDNGSVAATIGIINGKIKVGLTEEDINILAKDNNVEKGTRYNPHRGAKVVAYCSILLDSIFGLQNSSFAHVSNFSLKGDDTSKELVITLSNEQETNLLNPSNFVGYIQNNEGKLTSILLKNNNLHIEIQIEKNMEPKIA